MRFPKCLVPVGESFGGFEVLVVLGVVGLTVEFGLTVNPTATPTAVETMRLARTATPVMTGEATATNIAD